MSNLFIYFFMEKIFLDHPWIILLILLWTLPWKGAALWIAARRGHVGWFLVLLILNTLAILDILYIFIFSKWGAEKNVSPKNENIDFQSGQELENRHHKFSYSSKNGKVLR